jgi:hypothetical protein
MAGSWCLLFPGNCINQQTTPPLNPGWATYSIYSSTKLRLANYSIVNHSTQTGPDIPSSLELLHPGWSNIKSYSPPLTQARPNSNLFPATEQGRIFHLTLHYSILAGPYIPSYYSLLNRLDQILHVTPTNQPWLDQILHLTHHLRLRLCCVKYHIFFSTTQPWLRQVLCQMGRLTLLMWSM